MLEAALAAHTFEVPESMVLRQVGHQIEHIREQMRRQGMDPERVPWDYQKMLGEMRPGAEKSVKRALLIEAIAEKEGLVPSDADVDAEVERIAETSQRPAAAVRGMLEKSGDLEALRLRLREQRALDALVREARVEQKGS